MLIFVYNEDMQLQHIVDSFNSFLWTDRYDECGDFSIEVSCTMENLSIFRKGYYLSIDESSHFMIVESVQLDSDPQNGDRLTISGRSLESILDRRIIWGQITFEANKPIQEVIKVLLRDAFMTEGDRFVSNFRFNESEALRLEPVLSDKDSQGYGAQFEGDSIYETIVSLCKLSKLGFKIGVNVAGEFTFSLYNGVDHSYDNESGNTFVIFSPKFENLLNSNYLESDAAYKNVALVVGEGEGTDQRMIAVGTDDTGLNRREMFVKATDISSTSWDEDGNEISISDADYYELLIQRGKEHLKGQNAFDSFEGQAEATNGFVYGSDFNLGDIVEIEDAYGHSCQCRVSEFVISYDTSSGYRTYPTFKKIEEEEESLNGYY